MSFDFGGSGGTQGTPPEAGFELPRGTIRLVKIGVGLLGLIGLFIVVSVARGVYTNWLWFDSLGFLNVFTTILVTRIWLFFVGAIVSAAIVGTSLYFANRFSQGPVYLPIPQRSYQWLRRLVVAGIILLAVIVSIIFGAVLSGKWETILLFSNSVSFGRTDPVFGKDASFYVFTMPVLHLVQGWLMGAMIVSLLGTVAVYAINVTLRGAKFTITPRLQAHVAILGAALLFTIGLAHFLDVYELLFSTQGAIFGGSYTDLNARRPALFLLTALAGFAGVVMLASLFLPTLQQRIRLTIGAFGLWAIAGIVVGLIFPTLIQRFVVSPNELQRETPFIERNIAWTRDGFALGRISVSNFDFQPDVSDQALLGNPETINNLRLWDPRPARDVYNQVQHLRLYYDFLDADVDRYMIDGKLRQVLLSARELSPEKVPGEAQRWINRTLVYTHGYGAVASPVTNFTAEGQPEFLLKDVPPQALPADGPLALTQPRIYYGENPKGFVVVNTKEPEFDHPNTEEQEDNNPVYTSYEGTGGVRLSSFLRRIAYAWEFTDINVLISGQIDTSKSRIQYRRQIQDRVSAVAPFLLLDADPYLVVSDGHLFWIQDAYTVTDRFPYSKPFQTPSGDQFNYIRNSVKVVIDAFNGTMRFFIAQPNDPLIMTYQSIFPVLFEDLDDMPEGLKPHIRYPEGLFSIQADTYLQYHMTDPTVFFNKEDQWSIPAEVVFGSPTQVRPYFIIMKLPRLSGETEQEYQDREAEFVQILPFTPANKPNLVAWLAARSDGENFGQLVAFTFPKDRQVFGPAQIEARIDNDTFISQQFTLWGQSGSTVIRGNLLVVPISDTVLYVEPVYLQAESLNLPELKRVILATATQVTMTPTLNEGVLALLGKVTPTVVLPTLGQPGGGGEVSDARLQQLREQLRALREELRDVGEGFSRLEDIVQSLEDLAGGSGE